MKEAESVVKQEWASLVADPLDYSFRDLDVIEDIVVIEPRISHVSDPSNPPDSKTPISTTQRPSSRSAALNTHAKTSRNPPLPVAPSDPPRAVRLSNNNLAHIVGLDSAINRVGEKRGLGGNLFEKIEWLDLSFNKLDKLDAE
ncbi:hypothetical protein HDU93_007982, partial [Gonapodya sp. JEL0774]